MNEGKIEQIGSAEDLYRKPESKFALQFIGEVNVNKNGFVRPECIRVVEEGQDAEVVDKIFMGNVIRYYLEVQNEIYEMIRLSCEKEYGIGDLLKVELNLQKIL